MVTTCSVFLFSAAAVAVAALAADSDTPPGRRGLEPAGLTINNSTILRMPEEKYFLEKWDSVAERKGCSTTKKCRIAGGYCFNPSRDECFGTVDPKSCSSRVKGKRKCRCCIIDQTTPNPSTCTCPAITSPPTPTPLTVTCPDITCPDITYPPTSTPLTVTCPSITRPPTPTPSIFTCPDITCPDITYPPTPTCPACPATTCASAPTTVPTTTTTTTTTTPVPTTTTTTTTTQGCPLSKGYFILNNQCFVNFRDQPRNFEEADGKCKSEGLVLAKPINAVAVRKYIVDNYGSGWGTFIGARGNGVTMEWIQDQVVLPTSSSLWAPNEPKDIRSTHCLRMLTYSSYMQRNPSRPFSAFSCSFRFYILCEKI